MKKYECQIYNNCKYYHCQSDRNGDVAIEFCSHPENSDKQEGNIRKSICPIGEAPAVINEINNKDELRNYNQTPNRPLEGIMSNRATE